MPKTIECRPLDDDKDPSSLAEPSISGQLRAAGKEEKKKEKRKYPGSLDAEVKKKRVVVRVWKSNKVYGSQGTKP